ncbi:MAG: hypothetical protein L3K04_04100 [Thermoplasmata archaeon]|nr:hypothetical protein [Thermoplasmata archaeon]
MTQHRVPGRLVYLATLVGIFALVGGFALATLTTTSNQLYAQGDYTSAAGAVVGFGYTSAQLTSTANPAPATPTGTSSAPQVLASGTNAFCANTCTAGDFALVATFTFTTSFSGAVQITITTSASSAGGSDVIYLAQASTAVSGTVVVTWDLGTSALTLTSITLTDQQCSSSTSCP